jgi:hypothetical protein
MSETVNKEKPVITLGTDIIPKLIEVYYDGRIFIDGVLAGKEEEVVTALLTFSKSHLEYVNQTNKICNDVYKENAALKEKLAKAKDEILEAFAYPHLSEGILKECLKELEEIK